MFSPMASADASSEPVVMWCYGPVALATHPASSQLIETRAASAL